ncbi:MAG: hypothetical protein JSU01_09765 [Bacteroidetes bacterium]|nr:hypothetical protein [Bacteroidota bacterium]
MEVKDVAIISAGAVLFYVIGKLLNRKRNYLQKHGIAEVAKIVQIDKTLVSIGNDSMAKRVYNIDLEIEIAGAVCRRVTIKQSFDEWRPPKLGDKVNILVDPRNPDNLIIVENP